MIIKNLLKNFFINSSFILLIFLLDRFSKIYVIYLDRKTYESEIFSSKFLNIHLVWNEGIAFGLFAFNENNFYNFLSIFIFIIILLIIYMVINSEGFKKYSLMILLGGALGNFFDRVFFKAVPDFIDFHVGNFHWFIFNVADIFITIGVFLMILLEFFDKNRKLV